MIVKTKLYLHSSKEGMAEVGGELGLKGDAADNFLYTLYEVKFDVEVDTETGEAFATAVNDKALVEKIVI